MAWNAPGQRGDTPPSRRGLQRWLPWVARSPFAVLVLGAWLAGSCFAIVAPEQTGVLLQNGVPLRVLAPGVHLKWPWPFQEVQWQRETGVRALVNRYTVPTVDGQAQALDQEVRVRVADALVHARVPADMAEAYVQAIATDAITRQFRQTPAAQGQLDSNALLAVQQQVEQAHLGLEVVGANWRQASVVPVASLPKAAPFAVPDAQALAAEADAILAHAQAERTQQLADATADAAHFRALMDAYARHPQATRALVFDEALGIDGQKTPATSAVGKTTPVSGSDAQKTTPRAATRTVDRSVDRAVNRSADRSTGRAP